MTPLLAWRIPNGEILRLSGRDATEWLQGQVTQDVRNLTGWAEACFTSATGQLQAHVYLRPADDGVEVVTGQPHVVRQRVDQFVVMEDITLETVQEEAWIATSRQPFAGFVRVGPLWLTPQSEPRVDRGHCQWWVCEEADATTVNALEIEAGIPRWGIDTSDKTLPPELGPAFEARTISYRKGCYTGQEVLMRIHSRGHTNRTWICLRSETPLIAGSVVTAHGNTAGTVHRVAGNLATATLKNDYAADGTVVSVDGVEATVKNWPL